MEQIFAILLPIRQCCSSNMPHGSEEMGMPQGNRWWFAFHTGGSFSPEIE